MSNYRVLTDEQVAEAKRLREELGYTKKELAKEFDVPATTIWYNIYGRKRKTKKIYLYKRQSDSYRYTDIKGFVTIVEDLRTKGLTSAEIAQVFSIPVEEINLIWCKTL